MQRIVGLSFILGLAACEQTTAPSKENEALHAQPIQTHSTVSALAIVEQPAKVMLPQCSAQACVDLNIQSLHSQDAWFNHWLSQAQAHVLLQEIGIKQSNLTLQQAVNRYVDASQKWQQHHPMHQPYQLNMQSQIAYAKNGYLLLQLRLAGQQGDIAFKDRIYFFIADRNSQKTLQLQYILVQSQISSMDKILQQYYQTWLHKQPSHLQLPKKLIWQHADWFYDTQGIGLHFRRGMLAEHSPQLDIYLSAEQSQRVLKPEIYQALF